MDIQSLGSIFFFFVGELHTSGVQPPVGYWDPLGLAVSGSLA